MQARGIELYALMLSDKVDFNGCQAKTTNSTVWSGTKDYSMSVIQMLLIYKQGVAVTGLNRTGPPCSVAVKL